MLQTLPTGPFAGGYLYGDIIPWLDLYYSLGDPTHRFLNVWAKNIYADPIWTTLLYASNNVFVNNKPVLKDGDPISIYDIQSQAQGVLSNLVQQYVTGPLGDYKEQILSQLQQIQTTLQNTNALINSHLARELYDTYSYMFEFDYPSGVLELFSPKPGYQSIIRGWYAVSTGTGGIANIKSKYSLTPVGLIPVSVPTLSFPNMFLGLYYDEPLLLYYDSVSLGTYLQLMLNVLQQWAGISVNHPSEVDPVPFPAPVGWEIFFDFLSPDELKAPTWYTYQLKVFEVHDNMLSLRGIAGGSGYCVYSNESIHSTKVVAVFRLRDVTGNLPACVLDFMVYSLGKYVDVFIRRGTLNPDGTITTSIYDYIGGTTLASDIVLRQGEWYVFMYDYTSNTVTLMDTKGNVLASGTPTQETTTDVGTYIYMQFYDGVHTLDIDWLGATQLYPSGIDPAQFMPVTGWKSFYNFLSMDEVLPTEWSLSNLELLEVQKSILTARGSSATYAVFGYRNTAVQMNRLAMALRLRDVKGSDASTLLYMYLANGSQKVVASLKGITLNPDGTITTSLCDELSGITLVPSITLGQGEWYAVVLDNPSVTVKVVDAKGNVLASGTLQPQSTTEVDTRATFYTVAGKVTYDLDWLGAG
jgi:hypothetical protein